MKKQSEVEKKEREAKFRRENLIPENELKPPGKETIYIKIPWLDNFFDKFQNF